MPREVHYLELPGLHLTFCQTCDGLQETPHHHVGPDFLGTDDLYKDVGLVLSYLPGARRPLDAQT